MKRKEKNDINNSKNNHDNSIYFLFVDHNFGL